MHRGSRGPLEELSLAPKDFMTQAFEESWPVADGEPLLRHRHRGPLFASEPEFSHDSCHMRKARNLGPHSNILKTSFLELYT